MLPTFLGATLAKPIRDSMVSPSAEEKNVIEEQREIAAKLQDLLSTQREQGHSRKP